MTYAPPSGEFTAIDVWKAKFIPINTDGTLKATAVTPYEGLELKKVKSIVSNLGTPRQIPVTAQGRTQTTFTLPAIDPKTIEGHLSYIDLDTYASLSSVKTRTIGGALTTLVSTNKESFEQKGILLVSQLLGHDADDSDVWYSNIFLRVKAVFTFPAMNENAMDVTVHFSVGSSRKHITGAALSESVDGATDAVMIPALTWGQLNIVGWLANGTASTFVLPTDKPANSTFADTFVVYNQTAGVVVAGTPSAVNFVATAAPATGKVLVGWYETLSGV